MRVIAFVSLGLAAAVGSLFAQALPASTAPSPSESIGLSTRRVPPGMMYHHIWIVSPLVGSGKPGDPKRPILVPAPPAPTSKAPLASVASQPAASTAETGLMGFQMQLSDDGNYALAELVFVSPLAFQNAVKNEIAARNISVAALPAGSTPAAVSGALESALESAVPGLQILERGQATEAQILAAFQQKKAGFTFSSTTSVRP